MPIVRSERGGGHDATRRREQSLAFVRAFAAGDLDALEALLASDLRFVGPLLRFESRAEYLESLRADPPAPLPFEVVGVFEASDGVCVVYTYGPPEREIVVAQVNRFDGTLISEILLVFDTRMMR